MIAIDPLLHLNSILDFLHSQKVISDDRYKKMRSSTRTFAVDVWGKKSVEELLLIDCLEPKAKRDERIDNKLFMASPHKLRNVKQEISQILRLAVEQGLIPDPETLPPRESEEKKLTWRNPPFPGPLPLRDSENHIIAPPYALRYANFSATLRQEVEEWVAWVKPSPEAKRPKSCEMRDTTIKGRIVWMELFFGYLVTYGGWTADTLSLVHLIDIDSLKAFVRWHSFQRDPGIKATTISATAESILKFAHSLANHYFNDEKAKTAIKEFQQQMGKSVAVKEKDQIVDGVTIKMLYDAAFNEFPTHPSAKPGQDEHLAATRGLAMALYIVGPLRNQNYREAVLGRNIIRVAPPTATTPGRWKLFFTGAAGPARLKRHRNKDGSINEYHATVPPEVCRLLDTYYEKYRPLVCRNEKEKTFLLDSEGKPFNMIRFRWVILKGFYRWLGKLLNPHILRDIISTETYETCGNANKAAELINDYPETFLARYNRRKPKEAHHFHQQRLMEMRQAPPKETDATKHISDEELILAIRARGFTQQQVFGY